MFIENRSKFEDIKAESYKVWKRLEDAKTLERISALEEKTLAPDFWDDKEHAEATFRDLSILKDGYFPWKKLIGEIDELEELMDMYGSEEDEDIRLEIQGQIDALGEKFHP